MCPIIISQKDKIQQSHPSLKNGKQKENKHCFCLHLR